MGRKSNRDSYVIQHAPQLGVCQLRRALGDHVAQRGSLNAPDRLRFDFSHGQGMTAAEQATVEAEVNAYIRQNTPVDTRIMTPDDARAIGAPHYAAA